MWTHATAHDRQVPDTKVLAQMGDARVTQFWDPHRIFSYTLLRELPNGLGFAMADTSGGGPPLIWDIGMVYPPGAKWGEKAPAPAYWATPLADSIGGFRAAVARGLLGRE